MTNVVACVQFFYVFNVDNQIRRILNKCVCADVQLYVFLCVKCIVLLVK
jgi:hypothetical protein